MIRKPNAISDPAVDQNFTTIYATRIVSRVRWDGISASRSIPAPYQTMETGDYRTSANGSATLVRSIPLQERPPVIVHAIAHVRHPGLLACVTDVTQSSITVQVSAWSQTGGISLTTTACVTVSFMVQGSSP